MSCTFHKSRELLLTKVTLAFPDPDMDLSIMTDASSSSVGSVVHQSKDVTVQPLAFFSKKQSPAEQKCSTYHRELLAVYATYNVFHTC